MKALLKFFNNIKLLFLNYFKNEFYIEILIYFKTDLFYFNQLLHNQFFKNPI
jgi:hypothetical protein